MKPGGAATEIIGDIEKRRIGIGHLQAAAQHLLRDIAACLREAIHEGNGKTAFRVSISKNCWNCFSQCGCGGNVLDFVAKKEKVSLPKAARLLVEWFNLKIESPENDPPRREKSDSRARDKSEPKREAAKPVEQQDEKGENKPLEFVLKNLQAEHPYL